jgi:hypothetical protein
VRANRYLAFAADGSLTYPVTQPAGPNAAEAYWWGGWAGGTANALTLSIGGAPSAYAAGQRYTFVAPSANTGPVTLAVNSLGVKPILRPDGNNLLAAGDIRAGTLISVTYDGTNFRLNDAQMDSTFTSDVTIQKNNPYLLLNKSASGQTAAVFGRTANLNRWGIWLGSDVNETGGNSGSDFVIRRYADDGTALSDPILITRSTGAVTFNHAVTMAQPLTLPASNPTDANHAARKGYVDAGLAAKAPLPQAASGVGHIFVINPGFGTGFTLPPGGAWLVFVNQFNTAKQYEFSPAFNVWAGGTSFSAPPSNITWIGWAWRIA